MAIIPLSAETAPHLLSLAAVIIAATVVGVVTARFTREHWAARADRRRHLLAVDRDRGIREAERAAEAQATRGAARIWHTRCLSAAESIRNLRQAGEWTAPLSVPPALLADDMKRVAGSLETSAWLKVERAEVVMATVVARQRVRLGARPDESRASAAWTAADNALAESAVAALADALDALAPLAKIDPAGFEPTVRTTTETVEHDGTRAPMEIVEEAGRRSALAGRVTGRGVTPPASAAEGASPR